jgi:hypothetical protein
MWTERDRWEGGMEMGGPVAHARGASRDGATGPRCADLGGIVTTNGAERLRS